MPSLNDLMTNKDYFEVLVIVEGIEPFTSSTVQARHPYRLGHDIVVNGEFMPCPFVKKDGTELTRLQLGLRSCSPAYIFAARLD